jgi:Tfp pilus assembly protein PilN
VNAINLLPVDLAQSARKKPSLAVAVAGAVPLLSVSLVIVGYTAAHSALAVKRADLAAVQAKVAELSPATLGSSADANLTSLRTARRAALDDALTKRVPWDATFRDVARVLPSNVWLTSLNVISPTPADASSAAPSSPNPNGFTIQGTTYSAHAVAVLLQRLQLLPELSNVALQSTTTGGGTTSKPLVQFEIAAVVRPPATASAT